MLLKNKLLKLKESDKNYHSFFYDKELNKECFLILTKNDILLCIDESKEQSLKEYHKYFIYYKIIRIYFDSSLLYIPISITKYKKSDFIYTDKFIVL